jgi:hypothetical protein
VPPEIVLRFPTDARLACVGRTGTGKSYLARRFFVNHNGRRVVIDPYDSDLTMGDWPTTREPRVDFGKSKTWRVVPVDPEDLDLYDELYQSLFVERHVLIWNDEIGAAAPSHGMPLGVRQVLYQGRKRHLSHISCSPRPRNVNPGVWAQSEYWGIFKLPFKPDRELVGASAGLPSRQFETYIAQLGPHGFIWWESPKDKILVIRDGLRPEGEAQPASYRKDDEIQEHELDEPAKPKGAKAS